MEKQKSKKKLIGAILLTLSVAAIILLKLPTNKQTEIKKCCFLDNTGEPIFCWESTQGRCITYTPLNQTSRDTGNTTTESTTRGS